jgi:polysaccharide pyruvyl transferase WcaK-like protein
MNRKIRFFCKRLNTRTANETTNVALKTQLKKEMNRISFAEDYLKTGVKPFLVHTAVFYKNGNAGDTFIREMTKKVFNEHSNLSMIEKNCREIFGKLEQSILNNSSGVVVGAGGLIWKRMDSKSNWQWNVSNRFLIQLERPIILFSVGVIIFGKEKRFNDTNIESLKIIFSKKNSIILPRNKTSYNELLTNVGKPKGYMAIQPCPSTIVRYYDKVRRNKKVSIVGVNIPMDKLDHRYGHIKDELFKRIAKSMLSLKGKGYEVKVYSHIPDDVLFHKWLTLNGYDFAHVDLSSMNYAQIKKTYENTSCVIGGRGHSVMIPFGIGTPVVGIKANLKVKYFHEEANKIFPLLSLETIASQGFERQVLEMINDKEWPRKNELICNSFYSATENNFTNIEKVLRLAS